MSLKLILFLNLTIVFFLTTILAYKPCVDIKSAPIDAKWATAKKKLYIINHGGCETCTKDEDWKWVAGRSLGATKSCYEVSLSLRGKPSTLTLKCEYAQFEEQACQFLSNKKDFGLKGWQRIVATNNATWYAGSICIYDKEQFWFIISPQPDINQVERRKALLEIKKAGLAINNQNKNILKLNEMNLIDNDC